MVRHILFDLDNTLYSAKWGLEDFFMERLKEYTSTWLGFPWEECEPIRKEAMKRYGTTLEWLVSEKGFTDVEDYFTFIHPENEADSLPADKELRLFIEGLPCRCSVLTNSPYFHAERIIGKLGLVGLFDQIFSIESYGNRFRGKPHASAYYHALNALGYKPEDVLFIDDSPRYASGYVDLGGKGILFDENDVHHNYPYEKIKSLRELTRFFDDLNALP